MSSAPIEFFALRMCGFSVGQICSMHREVILPKAFIQAFISVLSSKFRPRLLSSLAFNSHDGKNLI